MTDAARFDQLVERLDAILAREIDAPFSRALNAGGAVHSPGTAANAWTAVADLLTEAAACATQLAAISPAQSEPFRGVDMQMGGRLAG